MCIAKTLLFLTFIVCSAASQLSGAVKNAQKLKLVYFDAKGVVEISRVLLKIGGMPFEDFRYPITAKEGGGFNTEEFTAAKDAGELSSNMDRVPIFYIDNVPLGQSKAIERFIAHRCNLMGSSDIEAAQIDCVAEHVRDIKEKWGKIRFTGGFGPNPEKDAAIKKWFEEGELTEWLVKLEKSLPPSKVENCSVGESTTYADVCIWNLLCDYFDNVDGITNSSKECRRLTQIADKVKSIEAVKSYLAERPATMF
jgi:hypothetical protein